MQATATDTVINNKIRELCQTILDQPEFQTLRRDIDAFLANETAQSQYQNVANRGETLQQKQQMGAPLDDSEVAEFERAREVLMSNPVARGFLDAQQAMHQMQETVNQHLGKTFELGRVPTADELESGSCGSGCGCH